MKGILTILVFFVFMLSVIISPIAVGKFIGSYKAVSASEEYVRKKVKVDSSTVQSTTYRNGGQASPTWRFYIHGMDRELVVEDHERNVFFGKQGDERDVPHLQSYQEMHHDSIWLWYHPSAPLKYARDDGSGFPLRRARVSLIVNGVLVAMAIYSIFWVIKFLIKRRNKAKA